MFFWHIRCPRCLKPIDSRFWHVNTGLGPKTILCPSCLTEIGTGRREWDEFGSGRRFLYYFLTTFYAIVFAVLGGAAAEVAYRETPSLGEGSPSIFGLKLFPTITVGLIFALLVVLVQIYRVKVSRRRFAAIPRPLINAGFFNLQARLQPKYFLIFVLTFFAGISPFVYRESRALYLKYVKPAAGKTGPSTPAVSAPEKPVPAAPMVGTPEPPKPAEPVVAPAPAVAPVAPPTELPKPAPVPVEPPKPEATPPIPPAPPAEPLQPEPKSAPPVTNEIQPLPVIPPEPRLETPKTDTQPVAPQNENPTETPTPAK